MYDVALSIFLSKKIRHFEAVVATLAHVDGNFRNRKTRIQFGAVATLLVYADNNPINIDFMVFLIFLFSTSNNFLSLNFTPIVVEYR